MRKWIRILHMVGGEMECIYSEDFISDALRYHDNPLNLLKYSIQ